MTTLDLDVLIIGGGIAGLWLQNRLHRQGYATVLVEADTLGGKQSVCSQGIIHGGTKYALNGMLTQAANAIAAMPGRWQAALRGEGDVDLRAARQLSDAHYMWSSGSLGGKLTSFFASKALRGRVDTPDADKPAIFQDPAFRGSLYRLNEIVLDVPSVLRALRLPGRQLRARAGDNLIFSDGVWTLTDGDLQIRARRTVLTAGEGTEALTRQLGLDIPMQRRPLQMVMAKHRYPHPIYAHCIGASSKPLATITTHPHQDGSQVWYIGGEVAESGVERSATEQIAHAREVVGKLLPWVDLGAAEWATLPINRAEPRQSGLVRPDTAYAQAVGEMIVCWPTKLALSADLSDQVLAMLPAPSGEVVTLPAGLPEPDVSLPIWDQLL
ncbi:FAD-dependent oxidoreductase [Pokkaliibacter sp. MBI-7]|uniref:FAD-dependent oxidoreductase n=1 Tax=Pokkaliibacter sp. MBI-7 TaxID=3040600 RepID=UPI00244C4FE8|nr:FAD-dependent oxidoreductase [Pokkaliibacter sp. MBI-7]MDH2432643.1 FAD-dependent oxidoreductase [Pokkaliibacter sp. MBI-7]